MVVRVRVAEREAAVVGVRIKVAVTEGRVEARAVGARVEVGMA